ncbi:hypothetical protein AYK26_02855 [Euryarchaeota archaeon SM23-78]|nr:MAG: hypothetical protein AYK26_02855 [Euryarchaeota archaeon SM23-78]
MASKIYYKLIVILLLTSLVALITNFFVALFSTPIASCDCFWNNIRGLLSTLIALVSGFIMFITMFKVYKLKQKLLKKFLHFLIGSWVVNLILMWILFIIFGNM